MYEPMTFLDFFSGVGGFRKGFELCGMVCKGHCEIDKFADRSYRAIHDIKEDNGMARTSQKPSPPTCRESTSGQADSRVRTFLYLAGNEGLQASEALSFLKSLDSSKARLPKIDPNGLSLKMLKICSPLIEDGTLRPFSIRWPKSAIISNTDCLIHASTAFRKTGNASTLSLIDILEPRVDEKYFLSPQATARLLYS